MSGKERTELFDMSTPYERSTLALVSPTGCQSGGETRGKTMSTPSTMSLNDPQYGEFQVPPYVLCLSHSTPDMASLVLFISLSVSLSYLAEKGKYEANR